LGWGCYWHRNAGTTSATLAASGSFWVAPKLQSSAVELNISLPKGRELLELVAEIIAVAVISWPAYGIPAAKNLDYTYFFFADNLIAMRHGFEVGAGGFVAQCQCGDVCKCQDWRQ
jgi:hypothetical protein